MCLFFFFLDICTHSIKQNAPDARLRNSEQFYSQNHKLNEIVRLIPFIRTLMFAEAAAPGRPIDSRHRVGVHLVWESCSDAPYKMDW